MFIITGILGGFAIRRANATTAPTIPTGVTAVPVSQTQIKVSWKASTSAVGLAGYKVYQDGKMVVATNNLNTSFVVNGLLPPTKHTYTVAAYDTAGTTSGISSGAVGTISLMSPYDGAVLTDGPSAFWDMAAGTETEVDLTGDGNTGDYMNGMPNAATLPNGDPAADLNGTNQYLSVPSNKSFSISTTGNLTWEAWVRADTSQFQYASSDGYVDLMGKCAAYSPTCEWEARTYGSTASRSNRFSAYVFNPSAGLGSAADWQPASGAVSTGQWVYVVGEYTTKGQPSNCSNSGSYPGSINIWVNGVPWSQASHSPTGCMSQYGVKPQTNSSPLNIGTMALDYWFKGAIGKVAIYNYLLNQSQIANHYKAMTGNTPAGTCGQTCSL